MYIHYIDQSSQCTFTHLPDLLLVYLLIIDLGLGEIHSCIMWPLHFLQILYDLGTLV